MRVPRLEANTPNCGDGVDNDGDGWPDLQDPSCARDFGRREVGVLSEFPCNDGIDNDGDGEIDRSDSGCNDGYDSEER